MQAQMVSGYAGTNPLKADVPMPEREIASLINRTRQRNESARLTAARLRDIRARLLGEHDAPEVAPQPGKLGSGPGYELLELANALAALFETLEDIERYTESLERI